VHPFRSTHFAPLRRMSDIRFQSFEDGDLADIWYALGGSAARHPDHFQKLMDECFQELVERREESLKPWLEERFRPFRLVDSREDAAINLRISPEARGAGTTPVDAGDERR
jgi:hypothetical protein